MKQRNIHTLIDNEAQLARVGRDAAFQASKRSGKGSNVMCWYACGGCTLVAFLALQALFFFRLGQLRAWDVEAHVLSRSSNTRTPHAVPIETGFHAGKRHYCLKVLHRAKLPTPQVLTDQFWVDRRANARKPRLMSSVPSAET